MAPKFLDDTIETPRSPRKVPPYPGFDIEGTYQPDSQQPRVKPEAEANFIRNRGSIDKLGFPWGENYESFNPEPRCPSSASLSNYNHGRHGTIRVLLDGSATPRPETAPPRVKPEAEEIADVSHGGRMCTLLTKYGTTGASPRVARVKPEAENTAEVYKGGRMNKLVHSYGQLPLSARGVPRVKPEAEETADVAKGKRMNGLIHKYGRLPLSARSVPRVKSEGEDNADLDKGKRMDRLIHSYGKRPLSARAVPRVKSEAQDNANLDKGGRMNRLMHSAGSLPPRNPPRIKNRDGSNILHRSRGSMAKFLRDMGNRTCIFQPGVRKSSYLKTAMM